MIRITTTQSKTVPRSSKDDGQSMRSVRRPAALFLPTTLPFGSGVLMKFVVPYPLCDHPHP